MKKYIFGLVAVLFVFGLILVPNLTFAQSTSSGLPEGCTSTSGYSPLTGIKCDTVVSPNLPLGCSSTSGYSPLTGIKCDTVISSNLPLGCTSTSGYSPLTGIKCDSGTTTSTTPSITVLSPNGGENLKDGDVVRITWKTTSLPSSQKLDIALEVPHLTWQNGTVGKNIITGIDNRGFYNWTVKALKPFYEPEGGTIVYPNGQYKINVSCRGGDGVCPISNNFDESDNYFTITSPTDDGCNGTVYSTTTGKKCDSTSPTISSVSGPQTLNVGQQGTWTVNASDKNEGTLTYSVDWGDQGVYGASSAQLKAQTQQSATFTHTYTNTGIYTPIFYVTNTSGQSAQTSLSVKVGNVENIPSLTVSLDSSTPIAQTITAGRGNVIFARIKITAGSQNVSNLNAIQIGSDLPNSVKLNNIRVYENDTQIGTTNYSLSYNGSYYQSWVYLKGAFIIPANTSKILSIMADTSPSGSGLFFTGNVRLGIAGWNFDSPGARVSPSGTAIYGNEFNVVSSTDDTPVISGVSGPQTLDFGQRGAWTVKAYNLSGGNLQYSVNWGESSVCSLGTACNSLSTSEQSANFYYTYNTTGTFTITFTVTNSNGKSAQASLSVRVGNTSIPSITTLSPTSGPVGTVVTVTGSNFGSNNIILFNGTITGIPSDGSSLKFTVPSNTPVGSYGVSVTNSANNYNSNTLIFTVTSSASTPVLNLFAVPTYVNVGQSVSFNFSAIDENNDNLSWSIDWGEPPYVSGTCSTTNSQQKQGWTWSGNHTWNTAGTYNAKVTVSDCKGGTASSNFTIRVADKIIATLPVPKNFAAAAATSGANIRVSWDPVQDATSYTLKRTNTNTTLYNGVETAFIDSGLSCGVVYTYTLYASNSVTNSDTISTTATTAPCVSVVPTTPTSTTPSFSISSLSANALGALDEATKTQTQTETNISLGCSNLTKTLAKGMDDPEVKCLQKMLGEKGFKVSGVKPGEEINHFGYATLMALKSFQTSVGLKADGIFGPASRAALQK